MSFIILNPLPEEMGNIAKNGEMIINSDLSLYIKKEDGTKEPVIGHKYEEFMFFLENHLKSFNGDVTDVDKYIKRFQDADLKSDKIIIYETDKTTNQLSDVLSKDLQKRGMKFVGSTIIYSFLQAVGIIYSHDKECFLYKE